MIDQTYTSAEVNGMVHSAVGALMSGTQLQANAHDAQGIRHRLASAISGGYDFADTLHNVYLDFGYPCQLKFFNFWNMYRRFGVAKRVAHAFPDATWRENPTLGSPSAQFLREFELFNEQFGVWRRLLDLDRRQRVGRYAGMFMRVRDGLSPELPIAGKLGGLGALGNMVPLYESQLEVIETQNSVTADDYGMPIMYQFNSGTAGNRNDRAQATFNIHPSRIVIASEEADNGNIYGVSSLESVYNSLMDLRKVLGGGGEGFYKNAAQSIVFDLKDAASANSNSALLQKFNEQYDDFSQNRSRRAMWTPGMDANVLDSSLVDPKGFVDGPMMDISAGSGVPVALLSGNQTGVLAGDQDTKGFLGNVNTRRNNYGTDLVRAVVEWTMRWGVLPSARYEVVWPDALAVSVADKLANSGKMADVNQKQFLSGGAPVFSEDEMREAAGFDPEDLPDDSSSEELPDDD